MTPERRALALGSGHQQHGRHRRRHARADGGHVGGDVLHRVVDAQPGIDRAARRVDVNRDVFRRVGRLEIEQLRLDDVGHIVVDRHAEEDDAVHHQTRKHVHAGHVQLALLDDCRRYVAVGHRCVVVEQVAAYPLVLDGKLPEVFGIEHGSENGVLRRRKAAAGRRCPAAVPVCVSLVIVCWQTAPRTLRG